MNPEEEKLLAALVRSRRWAALATLGRTGPEVSWVAYAPEPDFSGFLLHLSTLSAHTRNLSVDPRLSLGISEQEKEFGDPQELARVTIQGRVEAIVRDTQDYRASAKRYLERLPDSERLFGFGDFLLFRLKPDKARFIGGFARAYTVDNEGLRKAALLGQ